MNFQNQEFKLNFNQHFEKQKEMEKKLNKTRDDWDGIVLKPPKSKVLVRMKRKREDDSLEEIYIRGMDPKKKKRKIDELFKGLSLDESKDYFSVFKKASKKELKEYLPQLKRRPLKKGSTRKETKEKIMKRHRKKSKGVRLKNVNDLRYNDNLSILNFDGDEEYGKEEPEKVGEVEYEYDYYMFSKVMSFSMEKLNDDGTERFFVYDDSEYDEDHDSDDSNDEGYYKNEYDDYVESSSSSDESERESDGEDIVYDDDEMKQYVEFVKMLKEKEENKMVIE